MSPCQCWPQRWHHAHRAEVKVSHHNGRASSGEGVCGGGRVGQPRIHFLNFFSTAAATPRCRRTHSQSDNSHCLTWKEECPLLSRSHWWRRGKHRKEAASTGPGMKSDTTVTTILAFLKEQLNWEVISLEINRCTKYWYKGTWSFGHCPSQQRCHQDSISIRDPLLTSTDISPWKIIG